LFEPLRWCGQGVRTRQAHWFLRLRCTASRGVDCRAGNGVTALNCVARRTQQLPHHKLRAGRDRCTLVFSLAPQPKNRDSLRASDELAGRLSDWRGSPAAQMGVSHFEQRQPLCGGTSRAAIERGDLSFIVFNQDFEGAVSLEFTLALLQEVNVGEAEVSLTM